MCTVSYIPLSLDRFVFSSNRDEAPQRSPDQLKTIRRWGQEILFPPDPMGGTWLATSSSGRIACILNGAFEAHHRKPPYRKSRGLVVLDVFSYPNIYAFCNEYVLENIEPFTLIVRDPKGFIELRWDGQKKHLKDLDPDHRYIWSAAMLYPKGKRYLREQWFAEWQNKTKEMNLSAIEYFHRKGGEPDPWYGFIMNRGNWVRTVSVSHLEQHLNRTHFHYEDLLRQQHTHQNLILTK